jgi:hypothetical protein
LSVLCSARVRSISFDTESGSIGSPRYSRKALGAEQETIWLVLDTFPAFPRLAAMWERYRLIAGSSLRMGFSSWLAPQRVMFPRRLPLASCSCVNLCLVGLVANEFTSVRGSTPRLRSPHRRTREFPPSI